MKLTIEIDMDNAAFIGSCIVTDENMATEDDCHTHAHEPTDEVRRILISVADRIMAGFNQWTILDINGNTVGKWEITDA